MNVNSISVFANRYCRLVFLVVGAGLIAFTVSLNHGHADSSVREPNAAAARVPANILPLTLSLRRSSNPLLDPVRLLVPGSSLRPSFLSAVQPAPFTPLATLTVNDIGDGHDGNPGDGICDTGVGFLTGACTFRAALEEYKAMAGGAGSTINFNLSGLPAIISASSVLPTLTRDVTITGPGAHLLKVRGNATFTMFTIDPLITVSISGLSIEGGRGTSASAGGGFTNHGTLMLNSCNVQGNAATNAGGILGLGSSTTNISNSSVIGNQATANGGAIFQVTTSTINLNNSTVALNSAGFGAVVNNGGTLNITSSTITANTSPGVFNAGSTSLYNTISASNTASDLSGNFTSNGHNLIGNGSGSTGFTNGVNGDIVAVNARLAPLNFFGGPTLTAALIKSTSGNSPAVDAGNNTSAPTTDQRGVARPFNTTVDIGAFEAKVDVSPASLPTGSQNVPYSQTLSGINGTGPYTFSLASGSFPAGITMSPAGVVSGTPTQTGNFTFVVIPLDANGFGGARSYTLTIGSAIVHHFVISSISSPQTAGSSFAITITAQDASNNTATGFSGAVSLSTTAGTISPTVTGAFINGTRTENVSVTQSGSGKTISVDDAGGGHTGTSNTFTVNPGSLHHFAIGNITTQTAGSAFGVGITAQDANNNTVTGFSGTVNLSTNAGAISPTTSGVFASGTRTENVTLTLAGSGKTISVNDGGGHTGTSNTFTVDPGNLHHFAIAPISSPQTAGTAFGITMTAQDANNNTVTGFTGTVGLNTTAGTITPSTSGTFVAGVRSENVTVTEAGSGKSISVNDGSSHTGTSNSFTVNVGALHHFAIANIGAQTAGTAFGITLTAQDFSGNTVISFTGTVGLSTTAGTITPLTSGTFAAGVRTENVTVTQAGDTKSISVNDGGGHTGMSNTFTVNPGALHHFAIGNISSPQTAGTAFDITITAQDSNNNTASSFVGTVNLSTTAGNISPTTSGAFSSGSRTQSVTVTQSGENKTVSINDGNGHSATSNTFTVGCPTITLLPASLPGGNFGEAYSNPLSAGGGSGSFTFAVTAGAAPTGLTLNSNGSWNGTPSAAGTFNFTVTATDTISSCTGAQVFAVTIAKGNQTITFAPLAGKTFGEPDFLVTATSDSALPVSLGATGNCTVTPTSPATVHITGVGSCTITASQAGDGNYNPAADVPQSFSIGKANQAIMFAPLAGKTFDDADFAVSTTSDSGLAVSLAASGNCTVTPVSPGTVHLTGVGLCTITASQAGDANYNPATDVPQSFSIGKANQTITFAALTNRTFGEADFTVNATSDSGLAVSLAASGNCTVTPVSPGTVHLTGTGSCTITASQASDANYNAAAEVPQSFIIAKGNQTITFAALANKTFGEPDFSVSPTSDSGLLVSLAASGTCTVTSVSPGTVHITGVGSCTITASQAGDANYNPAADVSQSFSIGKTNQTITFAALANKTFGDADFAVTASADSGLSVSLAASGSCTVTSPAPGTVHLSGVGSCTITASQAGDANYNPATDVPQSFSIAKANQTISFTAIANKTFGEPDFSVSATSDSGLPVNFAASGNCTVTPASPGTVHLTGVGSCTITASQAGDANYNPAADVQQSFSIGKADQAITFAALANRTFGEADFTVSATSDASLPVSLAASGNCTVTAASPGTVHLTSTGSCTITASQAGDGNYNPATDVPQSFSIGNANQTITFAALANRTFGEADFTVNATSGSRLPVSLAASGNCTVTPLSPGTVHLTGAGSCTITASQAGDTNYNPAADVPQSFSIAKANQTISFSALANKPFGAPDFSVSATSTSSLLVSLAATGNCAVTPTAPGTVHLSGVGSCTITASQAGDANFNAATDVPQSFSIGKADQAITFAVLANRTFGEADFNVSATSDASLPVSIAATGNCTVTPLSPGTVHLTGAGSCTITASQAGDANYNPAADVPQSFSISKANQTISFAALAHKTFGDADFVVSTTADSGLLVSLAATGNCTVTPASPGTVHLTGVGACTITASQAGDTNYNPAADVPQSFSVDKANQAITFAALANKTFGEADFVVTATSDSGLLVSLAATGNCTVTPTSPGTVHLTGVGSCTITASQAGDANYNPATDVPQSLSIAKANQTISFAALANKAFGAPDFSVSATSSAGLPVSLAATGNCTVTTTSPGTVHISGVGSCTITASQAGDTNYNPAVDVPQSFSIGNGNQTITFAPLGNRTFGEADFTVNATADSSLPVSLGASGNCTVTSPAPGTVHLTGAGSCTITASQAGNANYNPAADVPQSFSIGKSNQTIIFAALTDKTFGAADFSVSAFSDSGLTVSLSASGSCTVTSASPGTVHISGVGQCTITASQAGDTNYNPAVDVPQSFSIGNGNQTITFAPLGNRAFGEANFTVSATSDASLPVSLAASGNCTVTPLAPGTVHLTGAGSCTITASQAGDTNYNPAADVPQSFSIGKANQTISFATLGNKAFGEPDFAVSATSDSALSVSLAASGHCSVTPTAPGTVHLTGVGSCTITASQAGDANYNPATDVPQSFSIAKANQTISFTAIANKTFGEPDFSVSATSDSGLPVNFAASGNCTVTPASPGTVHLTGVGSCTITASQAGDANYNPAADVPQSFGIGKANQTITFAALTNKTFGEVDFIVGATTDSGLSVSLAASGNCTVTAASPGTVHLTSTGSCTITASQAGDGNYNPATDVLQSFSIGKANQTITFAAIANRTFGEADFAVNATSDSGLTVNFVATGNCTVTPTSPGTVHLTSVGSCTITASQAGDANYNPATDVPQSFSIDKADQSITFAALAYKTFGEADFTVSATSDSSLPVSLAATGNCTVSPASPGTVHLTSAGSCTITASQAGNANFNPATDVSQSFSIDKANQTVTFAALTSKAFGDTDFLVNASSDSSLAVTLAATGNCSVTPTSPGTVHLTGAGSCTVTASQVGNANYNAAADVLQSFNIAKANQTITFGALTDKTFGDSDFSVGATASSGLTVGFAATGNCTVTPTSPGTVHLTGSGLCTITAAQAGDSNYEAASSVSQTFSITEVNVAPTAVADTLTRVAEDSGPRAIPFADLTGNDTKGGAGENGQNLVVITATNAIGGTVILVPGFAVFTPTNDFNGPASFEYTVQDNGTTNGVPDPRTSGKAVVQFNISEVNDAPTAVNDTLGNVAEDSGERTIAFAELTANDLRGPANEGGQGLIVKTVSNPVGVTVNIVAGTLSITPLVDYHGVASFRYTIEDDGTTNGFVAQKTGGPAVAQFNITAVAGAPSVTNATTRANTQTTSGLVISRHPADGAEVTHFRVTNISGGLLFQHDGITPINNGDFITFAEGNAGLRFTPGTANGSFTVQSSLGATEAGLVGGTATAIITIDPTVSVIRFSEANYSVAEGAGSMTITVERTGDTSQAVTVDYASSDYSDPADFMPCTSPGAGFASSRCDFSTAVGRLRFAAGETSKTFNVLISQDNDLEGPETLDLTLSNLTAGAEFGGPSTAILEITDDATEEATNPVDTSADFVTAQYHDMLNRVPDGPGLAFWTDNIEKCKDPARRPGGLTVEQCVDKQRESTAVAFFSSPEFQMTGAFVYRLYKGSLTGAPNYDGGSTSSSPGRFPTSLEFMRDVSQVSEGIVVNNQISGAVVEANRNRLAAEFVQRPEFVAKYGGMNDTLYVDELFNTTGIAANAAEKQALVDGLTDGTETRASVLRKVVDGTVVINEGNVLFTTTYGQAFYEQENQRVFVFMEYVGYLRRNPDTAGFIHWLGKLDQYHGDPFQAEMVRSFILAPEYRNRFGQ